MPQQINLKARGLSSFPNQISGDAPEGSLSQADNVVIDRDGVLEPRRGFNTLPGSLGSTPADVANQLFRYSSSVISHYGPIDAPDTLAFYAPTTTISGIQSSSINPTIITNLNSIVGLYVGQYVHGEIVEQAFTGDIVTASNTITNVLSTTGLFAGQTVGGLGIPNAATISTITGSGPFTVTMSTAATFTHTNASFIASNRNILGLTSSAKILTVNPTNIVLDQAATTSSRTLAFVTADIGTNLINYPINGLVDGDAVQFTTTGTLPTGLVVGTEYYIINADDSLFQLSLSFNGGAVTFTQIGSSGNHTLHVRNYLDCSGWIDYTGTYSKPSYDAKIRSVEANNNVYFTTSTGIQKLDSLTSTIIPSGVPKGLDGFATLNASVSGFMDTDVQVAYRIIWGYKDLNKNLILGVPSQRIVIANTSGDTKDVDLNITIPKGITVNYFFQAYRSGFSANANSEPNDEMALVYEANPSAVNITAGFVAFPDQTPETLRNGAKIYTAPSQEGILQSNEPPPLAKDVCLFKGSVFYANTQSKQNTTLSILAVSGQFDFTADLVTPPADTPTTVRNPSVDINSLQIGQLITGIVGIQPLTILIQIYNTLTSNGNTYSSFLVDGLLSTATLKVGQLVTGAGIDLNTTIATILPGGTSIKLSKIATLTSGSPVPLTFHEGFQISLPATVAGTQTLTAKNGTSGIQLDDTITIDRTTFTAKLVENITNKEFQIFALGSPAQNIADTALSLIRVINRTPPPVPSFDAYYTSNFDSLPGEMNFEERVFGGGTFYITANTALAGQAYSPNLPAALGTTVASENDQYSNGLYFSKTQQPEAVPLLNFTKVGSADAAILRIIPLRDSLFVLKEDGVFRLTGENPASFRVDLYDSTCQILSAESAVSLNNLIFMLSKYGIVMLSDTKIEVISRPIEDKILDLFEVDADKAKLLSFGIAYESDRKYIFSCVTSNDDQYATQAYVYNTFTTTWTRWVHSQTCGLVHPKFDLIYTGSGITNTFDVERKSRSYTDYTDSSFLVDLLTVVGTTTATSNTITGVTNSSYFEINQPLSGIGIPDNARIVAIPDSTTLVINMPCTLTNTTTLFLDGGKTIIPSALTDIVLGDVFWQTDGRYSIITDINPDTGTITVRDFIDNWVLGSSSILKAFESNVKYIPQTAKNPGTLKQFRETTLLFQIAYFNQLNIGFDTDLSSGTTYVPLSGLYGSQFGRFPFGMIPWGGTPKPFPLRTYPPQQKQRCSLMIISLQHREAYSFYRLNGLSFICNGLSERVGR